MKVLLEMMVLWGCMSKIFETEVSLIKLSKKQALYVTKFKFYDKGRFTLEASLANLNQQVDPASTATYTLGMLSHKEYLEFEQAKTCEQKLGNTTRSVVIPQSVGTGHRVTHSFEKNKNKAEYVYFVILDCAGDSKKFYTRNSKKSPLLKLSFDFKNDESHYEAGEESLVRAYTLAAVVFLGIFGLMARSFFQEVIKSDQEEVNTAYLLVNSSLLLKIFSLFLDIIDLYAIGINGSGFIFLNFLSQASNHVSQYILTILLIFLARGWTIHFQSMDSFELFLPISILIGIFNVIIIGLGKMEDNSALFFHRYDSFIGWILAAFNIGLYIYFMISLVDTASKSRTNRKHQSFFFNLAVFGSVYFFLFPFLMILSLWVDPERRMEVIELGRILSQLIALTFMAYVTSSKRGLYKQVLSFGNELPSRVE